ncbi:MAG: ATPase [Desulfobacterales bacterium]|nr:MAG: ATPase [Desulfobacterales bacterium]
MITRMKISGFKNLVDVDVRFGPFTCVAGVNGVGKSNLFDAIIFLSALAEKQLIEAAMSVRGEGGRAADVRHLFHRSGDDYSDKMSFEVEMIIPPKGMDDFGQIAEASITFLRYSVSLAYCRENGKGIRGGLELLREELEPIKLGDASKHLLFPHNVAAWRKSAVRGRRSALFISTEGDGPQRIVRMHQDSGGGRTEKWRRGPGSPFPAATLPRTVLSSATNAAVAPTALLARRELQAWRLLQLEPSALRKPDDIAAPRKLGANGSHLPATLYRIAGDRQNTDDVINNNMATQVYTDVAGSLSELIDDVREVRIVRDEKGESLTLEVVDREGTAHPARSLSDGSLRFLALTVLGMDSEEQGLLCLEEPENGIHPERIPSMIELLQDIATDTNNPLGEDNPLSQVIINTHSPAVVSQITDDSLLIAELKEYVVGGKRFKGLSLGCLDQTWRIKAPENINVVSKGKLLSYLNPIRPQSDTDKWDSYSGKKRKEKKARQRVVDRDDIQPLLPFFEGK